MSIIATNIDMAQEDEGPICQDTGMPTFFVHTPVGVNQIAIAKAIRAATAEATRRGKLRPNSVDSLTGTNSGDNLGVETPVIHFEQWENDDIEVKLLLKGGGCENKNAQYSLPCTLEHLGRADRTLEGVRKCILHAVWQAQGQGCAPGAIGVCIGSDRAHGYVLAKGELFRHLGRCESGSGTGETRSRDHGAGQHAGRGTDGVRWTRIADRMQGHGCEPLPASFFVSVAYDCWAFRRLGREAGRIDRALSQVGCIAIPSASWRRWPQEAGFPLTGREIVLTPPLTEEQMRSLEGRRHRDHQWRDVYRPRRRSRVPDEESAACGSEWRRAVSLRSCDAEARRPVDRQGSRSDNQYSGRALSGGCHQALWRTRGDRKRRYGPEDACGVEGSWSRVSEWHRRGSAVLCAHGSKKC